MSRSRRTKIARALWVAWAVIVWNVVFDRIIVVAGRDYIRTAIDAAAAGRPHPRIDDFMRPAVPHGLWVSSVSALTLLIVGLLSIAYATRHDRLLSER